MKPSLVSAVVVLALLTLAAASTRGQDGAGTPTPPAIGSKLPAIGLETLAGKKLSLDKLGAKPFILAFFTTYSPECGAQMPLLQEVYDANRDSGLQIILISCDQGGRAVVESFRDHHKVSFQVALFSLEAIQKLGVKMVPTLLAVDAGGILRQRHNGYTDATGLRKTVAALLTNKR